MGKKGTWKIKKRLDYVINYISNKKTWDELEMS